jgi:hypothetical protein
LKKRTGNPSLYIICCQHGTVSVARQETRSLSMIDVKVLLLLSLSPVVVLFNQMTFLAYSDHGGFVSPGKEENRKKIQRWIATAHFLQIPLIHRVC